MSPPRGGLYAKTIESERIKASVTLLRTNLYSKVSLMCQVKINLCRSRPYSTRFDLLTLPDLLHSLTSLNKLLALESLPQGLLLGNPTHSKSLGFMVGEGVKLLHCLKLDRPARKADPNYSRTRCPKGSN